MPQSLKLARIVQSIFERFGLGLTTSDTLKQLRSDQDSWQKIAVVANSGIEIAPLLFNYLQRSKSQLHQDLFVLSVLDLKRNGFFVEFGATDGIGLSNTWLLEKEFGWSGILVEPARCFHQMLRQNRNCQIDTRVVFRNSKSRVEFVETPDAYLSGISQISPTLKQRQKKSLTKYSVQSVSLLDLLLEHRAPRVVDYLSLDTEGSEFEILKDFDFSRFEFRVITCEHNFTPRREAVLDLLTEKGYERVFANISRWDDWYIKNI